jgi:hypothetical protein
MLEEEISTEASKSNKVINGVHGEPTTVAACHRSQHQLSSGTAKFFILDQQQYCQLKLPSQ